MNRGKIKIIVFVLAVLSSALFVSRAFIYDTNIAHPGLTKLAAELYNQQGGQLTSQEIKWLQQGAIEEDTPFRWMNHFFDPIHNVGLKSSYDTAKKWAGNATNQASYSKGDQTWQRAINYWQKGDKEKALIALGHILHLLEDMTVPAHTRDDAHPEGDPYEVWVKNNFKAINGEWTYFDKLDRYFDYLANYSNNNFYSEDTIESKQFSLLNIDDFDAKEVNNGFLRKYFFRQKATKQYLFWVDIQPLWLGGGIIKKSLNDNLILSNHYSLLAPKAIGAGAGVIKLFFEEVQKQQAYGKPFWQTNPLGIVQGDTVGTAENLAQIYQNTSIQLGNLWDAGKKLVWNIGDAQTTYDFFTELFATNIVLAQELKNLQQTGQNLVAVPVKIVAETGRAIEEAIIDSSVAPLPQNDNSGQGTGEIASALPRNDTDGIASSPAAPRNDNAPQNDMGGDLLAGFVVIPSAVAKDSSASPQNDKEVAQNDKKAKNGNTNKGSVAYSGGGSSWSSSAPAAASGASAPSSDSLPVGEIASSTSSPRNDIVSEDDNAESPPPPPDTTPPAAPIIIDPSSSSVYTTSSAFTLAGSVSTDTIKLFLNNIEIPMGVAVWSANTELAEGENIFAFTTQDIAGNTSATSSVKIIKDTVGPTAQISIKRTSANIIKIDWSGNDAGSGVASYNLDYQTADLGGASTSSLTNWKTSSTSTADNFAVEFGKQYSFRVRAMDALGNIGEWTQSSAQEIALPHVVINEIAWAGTKANANDEWMELYNSADYDFDASGWTLTDGNDIKITFATGTIIKSQQYFLLERTNDQTISDITADLIYTGSLHNSGENLQLKDAQGRLLDEVDASKKWFAGKPDNDKESMERIDPLISGNTAGNWQSVGLPARRGHDAKNNYISGTPKKFNSSFNFLNGIATGDKTLAAQFSPYFLGNFTVATGTTLTIPPGIIIKSGRPTVSDGFLRVYGALITQGTADSPIIFTSYRDATQAGNTNPWNDSAAPAPGDWNRLQFYPGSSAALANTQVLYGNYRSKTTDPDGALLADGAAINATGLTVKWTRSTDTAINLINSSSTLASCIIAQNYKGVAASNGLLSVSDCLFENNGLQAIYSANAGISLKNNTFINNGWDNGKLEWWKQSPYGPVAVRDAAPEVEGNNFINNAVNALDWGGTISTSGTLKIENDWPLVSNGFVVAAGATLQISPGTIFKMKPGANIIINGAVEANGLPEKKIIFTSWRDDSDGFDSNGDSASSTPNPMGLEWQQMKFEGATSTLENTIIRYANQTAKVGDPNGSLYINNTPITINNLLLEYSSIPGAAVHLKNASQAEIKNSVIKNYAIGTLSQPTIGLKIDAGALKISSTIVDTFTNGLQVINSPDLSGVSVEYINAP